VAVVVVGSAHAPSEARRREVGDWRAMLMLRCAGYNLKREEWEGYIGWTRVGRRSK
jgi:hypothetical protein